MQKKILNQGFWFFYLEMDVLNLSGDFSLISQRNLDFKGYSNAEMSLEHTGNKIFKDYIVQKVWSIEKSKNPYTIKER